MMEKHLEKHLKRHERIQKAKTKTAKIWDKLLQCPYRNKREKLDRKLEQQILKTSQLMQNYGLFEPDWFVKVYFSITAD